jgi:hypothetical protein
LSPYISATLSAEFILQKPVPYFRHYETVSIMPARYDAAVNPSLENFSTLAVA